MVISSLSEFIVSFIVLIILFWIIKDVSKTLISSCYEEDKIKSCNCEFKNKEKKSRRYRYDDSILDNEEL